MDIIDKRLKPCPLCGSKEVAIKLPKDDDDFLVKSYYVKCYSCGLTGFRNFFYKRISEDEQINRVIKYWNTRHEVIV